MHGILLKLQSMFGIAARNLKKICDIVFTAFQENIPTVSDYEITVEIGTPARASLNR